MGVHNLISEVEAAAGLVKEWLREVKTDPAGEALPAQISTSATRCTRTVGCELAPEHEGGCQLEGQFTADPKTAAPERK
jgi:hypothetical protein